MMMFRKVLVANRGEIALRIISACKDIGVRTVAVYSEADRHSLHVRFADEAVCIGPAKSSLSYLDIPSIISAAEITNADAIHPGYGFLSENADFAEVCDISGIKFIGPSPDLIRTMGLKERARNTMRTLGIPVLPGSEDAVADPSEAADLAASIGYPVMLKAIAGGGGRGMRIVHGPDQMEPSFVQASQEAGASFSCPGLYLEKLVEHARHIEFQVIADEFGNVRVLGERDCSIQRRHQKLVEESPSPAIRPEVRDRMCSQLESAMSDLGYTNAGTLEFLLDSRGDLYFIEMNTRIQVEHPVTEMVTGTDLVKAQILIAAGHTLDEVLPNPIEERGHAIECRINAEDPFKFTPSPGRITGWNIPVGIGVRVETVGYTDYVIPPYYDSMLAKLITWGRDRDEAIVRMRRALEMFVVEGVKTSIPLLQSILADPDFESGSYDTSFINRYSSSKPPVPIAAMAEAG